MPDDAHPIEGGLQHPVDANPIWDFFGGHHHRPGQAVAGFAENVYTDTVGCQEFGQVRQN